MDGSILVAPATGGKTIVVGKDGALRLNADGSVDATFRDRGAFRDLPREPDNALVSGQKMFIAGIERASDDVGANVASVFIRKVNLATGSPDANGGTGADQLFGEGGLDRLYADDTTDADFIYVDTLHGGAGDDILVSRDGGPDELFGDGGHDTATADPSPTDVLNSIEVTE